MRTVAFVFSMLILSQAQAQDRYRIDAFAGRPAPDNVAATSTFFGSPEGLAFDSGGNLYVGEVNGSRIRRIAAGTTLTTTFAGTGRHQSPGVNGSVSVATFGDPRYVAIDGSGNIYVSEWANCVVRRIDAATHTVSDYAGMGPANCGYNGEGPATSAQLYNPRGIALDSAGNLYIADNNNRRVRRVDAVTKAMSTFAGNGTWGNNGDGGPATGAQLGGPFGLAFDSAGNLYISENAGRIRKVDKSTGYISRYAGPANGGNGFHGDGGPALNALFGPLRSLAFDSADNLFVSDMSNRRVRRIDNVTKYVTTYAGNGTMASTGDGGVATSAALDVPDGLAIDTGGNLYIADFNSNRIRKVAPGAAPQISTFAGSLGPESVTATQGFLLLPEGLTADAGGNVFIADLLNSRIRRVDRTNTITTVAGLGYGAPVNGENVLASAATMYNPDDVAFDQQGNLYYSDQSNNVVRKIDATSGLVTTVAGTGTAGYNGDAQLAVSAQLSSPNGVAVSALGEIFIADYGNSRVRLVTPDGHIHTAVGTGDPGYNGDGKGGGATQLNEPTGVAIDDARRILYIADYGNNMVRMISEANPVVTTLAGTGPAGFNWDGTATARMLNGPQGVWVNPAGDVFFTDSGNNLVRRLIFGQNWLVTIAGDLSFGHGGDGGPALSAQLGGPSYVKGDGSGHLFVSDGDMVRRLTPQFLLTTAVNPSGGGTITPGGYFDAGTNVLVSASAANGFTFTGFSGDATGTAPVSVTMNATRSVVANFNPLNPSILGAVTAKANGTGVNERVYTLMLTNIGLGPGTSCAVTAASMVRTAGTGANPVLIALPAAYGALAVGGQASQTLRATVLPTVLRFNLTVGGSCRNVVGSVVPFTSTISVFR